MSLSFNIDARHPTPLYHQLERAIRFAIATGKLGIGDQLPTVRQLAVDLRINANTVAKVYLELERAGVVETRRGVGTFVKSRSLGASHETDREHELCDLEDQFLAQAANLGFSAKDIDGSKKRNEASKRRINHGTHHKGHSTGANQIRASRAKRAAFEHRSGNAVSGSA